MLTIPPYIARLIDAVPGDVLVTLSAKQINDRLKKICQSLGIPPLSFHKLRHLNASVMAMLQIQKEIAMDRGGWKNTSVMDNTYTHVFSPQRQLADQRIDAYFSGIIELYFKHFLTTFICSNPLTSTKLSKKPPFQYEVGGFFMLGFH